MSQPTTRVRGHAAASARFTRARQQIGFRPSRSLTDIIQEVAAQQIADGPRVSVLSN